MGRLRDALARLRREMRGELESFELLDGSRYYYEPMEAHKAVFLHGLRCMTADSSEGWPAPPEVYLKMCEARDPEAVLERLTSAEIVEFPYDREALVSEWRLVPVEHEPIKDLSEP
jgi:hypothetical protein